MPAITITKLSFSSLFSTLSSHLPSLISLTHLSPIQPCRPTIPASSPSPLATIISGEPTPLHLSLFSPISLSLFPSFFLCFLSCFSFFISFSFLLFSPSSLPFNVMEHPFHSFSLSNSLSVPSLSYSILSFFHSVFFILLVNGPPRPTITTNQWATDQVGPTTSYHHHHFRVDPASFSSPNCRPSTHLFAEMLKCSPSPTKKLSKYAPLIHVMKVKPDKVNVIIGSGGKKVKSTIEESGVEAIDMQDNGIVKITAKDLISLEKSKAMISSLTMVPTIGDVYRNCEIKSIAPYGVFIEIAPGGEGLCHISELSSNWLAKAEDVSINFFLFIIWIYICIRQRPTVLKIHVMMEALLLFKVQKLICASEDQSYMKKVEQIKESIRERMVVEQVNLDYVPGGVNDKHDPKPH